MTPRLGPGRRWGREREVFEGGGRIEFENSQIHFGGPGLEVGGGGFSPVDSGRPGRLPPQLECRSQNPCCHCPLERFVGCT